MIIQVWEQILSKGNNFVLDFCDNSNVGVNIVQDNNFVPRLKI